MILSRWKARVALARRRRSDRKRAEEAFAAKLSLDPTLGEPQDASLAKAIVASVLAVAVGFVVWAGLTPIHEVVTGEGRILTEDGARPARHLDGGVVATLLVSNGQHVSQGEPLLTIDVEEAQAALDSVVARQGALTAERDRRRLALQNAGRLGDLDGLSAQQRDILLAKAEAFAAQRALLDADLAVARTEKAQAVTLRRSAQDDLALTKAAAERVTALSDRGLATQNAREEAQRALVAARAALSRAEGAVATSAARVARAQEALRELQASRIAEHQRRIAAISDELRALKSEADRLRPRIARAALRAPVSGVVQDLAIRNAGEIIGAGDVVASIVPVAQDLVVDLQIPADQIGAVHVGQAANVRVLAYDSARFGSVPAEVQAISASSTLDGSGVAFYAVRLRPLSDTVGASTNPLAPGLTVMADLLTGEKTALEYFLKPIRVLRDRALTEA